MEDLEGSDHSDREVFMRLQNILNEGSFEMFQSCLDALSVEGKKKLVKLLLQNENSEMEELEPPPLSSWTSHYSYTQTREDDWEATSTRKQGIPHVYIVLPSQTVAAAELEKITGIMHYEERQLFHLLRLQEPSSRVVYLTSIPIHPSIVQYYLSLLPSETDVGDRLIMMSAFDSSIRPLANKVLDRPRMMEKLKNIVTRASATASITCFIPTKVEHVVSEKLDIPINAACVDVEEWGTKCGSRKIFRDLDIPCPAGIFHSIYDEDVLAREILALWRGRPKLRRLMVKLNEGFSGEGNALYDTTPVRDLIFANYKLESTRHKSNVSEEDKLGYIKQELRNMRFQANGETWEAFYGRVKVLGCIIEEYQEGVGKQSPSCQGMIHHDGSVEILSTHEQILGGPDGQVYQGCRFPCDDAYRTRLHEYTLKVGKSLAEKGARDRFGVDFIAVPGSSDFSKGKLYALEINLRTGGTTHPYETLRLLTRGKYHLEDGIFRTEDGTPKYYLASDCLQKEAYRGLLPSDLKSIMKEHGVRFDHTSQTGVVFHLMGAMSEYGKVGLTCIANSFSDAEDMYVKVEKVLDGETKKA